MHQYKMDKYSCTYALVQLYLYMYLYKIGVTVHRCLQSKAPKYPTNCCTPVSEIASRRHLRSASRHHLSYHVTGLQPSVVEPSLLQIGGSETLYRTVSGTQLSAAAISGNYLRWTCSTVTQHTQRSRDAA